jgi:hypothetical protein
MTEAAKWTRVDDGCFEMDLLTASYRQHAFTRHAHTTFAIGVVVAGEEQFQYRGELRRAGVGSLAILEPDEPHDGRAAAEGGWSYRVLYPSEAMLLDGRAPRTRSSPPASTRLPPTRSSRGRSKPSSGTTAGRRMVEPPPGRRRSARRTRRPCGRSARSANG